MLKYLLQRALLGAVVGIAPRAEWAQFHLGNAHAEHGHKERALGPWAAACEHTPPRAAAVLNLAGAWLERGEPASAIAPLQRLVEHAPQNAAAWGLLAKAHQKAGAHPEAISALERLIALEPGNDVARLTAAALLEKSRRPEEAVPHYRAITDPALRPKAALRLAALTSPRRAGS